MLALVLVVVALVSALTAMRFAIHGQVVTVPTVVGLTPADAERAASGLGLQIDVERQYYSPQIPEGRIMTQMPLAGMKVRRGWQVRVARSLGPQRVVIPDVTKQSERAAEWNIQRRGLEVASTAEMQLPGAQADQVLAQSPAGKCEPGGRAKNQPAGDGDARSTGICDAEFSRTASGQYEPHAAGYGLQAGEREHGPEANATGADSATANNAPSSSTSAATPQPSPASIIVTQWPAAGQKVLAGAVVSFEVK